MSELESPGKAELSVLGDIYRFAWPCGIEAEVERFSEHRDELTAEVTIRSSRPPRPGLLHSARVNLMSTQTRTTLARTLRERDEDLDWGGLLEGLCYLARERYRTGDPAINLLEHTPATLARWLIEPFAERGRPTVLFADGGTGKSYVALAIAVAVASGAAIVGRPHGDPCPVLYLDWETDADSVYERLAAIRRGNDVGPMAPIYYRRLWASLAESAANIRRDAAKLEVGFVIVDPLGNARGGEPESAEVTLRMFNAARSIGVPWLGVDHVTKAAGNDSTRPFGSTYTHNSAGLTWSMDNAQDEGDHGFNVVLTNRKRNNGRLLPKMAYRIDIEDADDRPVAVQFRQIDVMAIPELAEKQGLKERILADLSRGGPANGYEVLADRLGVDHDERNKLRARVSDLRRAGKVVEVDGLIVLAARASA